MTQEQIEAVRADLRRSFEVWAEPLDKLAGEALDHLTKANEELRAEVENRLTIGEHLEVAHYRTRLQESESDRQEMRTRITELEAEVVRLRDEARATIDRLTHDFRSRLTVAGERHYAMAKERARAVAKLTMTTDELETFRHDNAAMQEAIDEAVRRADVPVGGDRWIAHAQDKIVATHIVEPLRPFATKPEPEVDPLVAAGLVFSYKGKEYKVTGVHDNYLMQYNDEWVPAVEYECLPDVGTTFCRALPEFQAKFRFVRNHTEGRTDG